MDAGVDDTNPVSDREQAGRMVAAQTLQGFDQLDSPWVSRSQIARQLEIPNSTLQYWLQQRQELFRNSRWPAQVVRFFDSPTGLACLHQMLTAAHLVFVQANDCGIRSLCWFLELSGLDQFIAPSYGAQRDVAEEMESLLIRFGQQEDQRLAEDMPQQEITLCEDETFHPQICLVAIEAVSNFILVEQYEPHRDAATWNRCLDERLACLPVTVCQVTSDQAKALITHTEIHLGAHHSPDLFHVQYDTVRATSLALAGQTGRAEKELEATQQQTLDVQQQGEACRQQCPQTSYVESLEKQLQQAQDDQAAAGQRVEDCRDRQQRATAARQGLGHDYHPFDLEDGRPLDDQEVSQRLAGHFETLEEVASQAELSSRALEKIAKARRVLDAMQATLRFFWTMIAVRFWSWQLSQAEQQLLREQLIPGFYLARAAEKADTAQERQRLRELSEEILARARSPDGLWDTLDVPRQSDLERKARACADLFQRSSSCVEGRNGHLSLKHHALHQLTHRKLQALTVLHNYLVQRPDGTTAAERFYGSQPRDLFAWLLAHQSHPSRPRARRAG